MWSCAGRASRGVNSDAPPHPPGATMTPAIAEDILRDSVIELHAAIVRLSPEAAFWYTRTVVRAARTLGLIEGDRS